MRHFALAGTLLVLSPLVSSVQAGGYANWEQSAAAIGRAAAVTASVDDASAAFYNPAAMARLDGNQFYAGIASFSPNLKFAGDDPFPGNDIDEQTGFKIYPEPNVYATFRVAPQWVLGASLNAPYGLGSEWESPEAYSGRYIAYSSVLIGVNLGISAAYAIDPRWSVALGGDAVVTHLKAKNRVPGSAFGCATEDVVDAEISSNPDPAYGWHAALLFTPDSKWRIAAVFRSQMIAEFGADARFTQLLSGDSACDAVVTGNLPPDQDVTSKMSYPNTYVAAVAWLPREDWTLETDFHFIEYSIWEETSFHFEQTPFLDSSVEWDFEDAIVLRVGGEHRHDRLALRAGYYYSEAAGPPKSMSPIYADMARHGIGGGAGYQFGQSNRFKMDVAYLALINRERGTEGTSTFGYEGTYRCVLHSFSMGVGYTW